MRQKGVTVVLGFKKLIARFGTTSKHNDSFVVKFETLRFYAGEVRQQLATMAVISSDPHSGLPPDWEVVVSEYSSEHVYYSVEPPHQRDDLAEAGNGAPRLSQAHGIRRHRQA